VGFLFAGSQLQDGYVDGQLVAPAGIDLAELKERLPREYWQPDLIRGAGTYLRNPVYLADPSNGGLRKELERLLAEGHPMAEYVVEGLSRELEFPLIRNLKQHLQRSLSFQEAIPAEYQDAWYRGLGMQIGGVLHRGWGNQSDLLKAHIAGIPEGGQAQFWVGVGFGVAADGAIPEERAAWSEWIPETQWARVWRGIGAAVRHARGEEFARTSLQPLLESLEPGRSLALEAGVLWPQYPSPAWFGRDGAGVQGD
jgi:hypothetical protein